MADFFHLMTYPFLACLLIAGIHVYLGLHVISRKVIFVDLALAQIAAFGAIYGVILGYDLQHDPWAIKGFSLLFAFLGAGVFSMTRMRHEKVPHEAVIGITYAVALAATILASINLPHGADEVRSLLAGSILWVRGETILYLAILYVAVGIFHIVYRERFLLISLDPLTAEKEGINVRLWDFLFYLSFGLVVTNSVAIGGVLLVFSYLVIPAVVAVLFAERVGTRLIIGWLVGTLVSIVGVVWSYTSDLPSGPVIVVCFAGFLVASAVIRYVIVAPSRKKSLIYLLSGSLIVLVFILMGKVFHHEEEVGIDHLISSPDKNERLMALKIAEENPDAWVDLEPGIIPMLHDPESEVRASAVSLVEKYEDSRFAGEILDRLTDPDDIVREAAVRCLRIIAGPERSDTLLALGRGEEDPYLKIEIANLIVDLGEQRGIDLYIDVMDDSEAAQARRDAYRHLVDRTEIDLPFDSEIAPRSNDEQVRPFRERAYR